MIGPEWILKIKLNSGFKIDFFSSLHVDTKKVAAIHRGCQKEYLRAGVSGDTAAPRIGEDYTKQLSEEIERRMIRKISHDFIRTKDRITGAL